MPNNPIICALDMMDIDRAVALTKAVRSKVAMVKLGLEFFSLYGTSGVQRIIELGVPVFLDLKLHDIPNTVARAINAVKCLDIAMLTIHVSGGKSMIRSSLDALLDTNILLAGVTVLTSLDEDDLSAFLGVRKSLESYVMRLVDLAVDAGLRAVVCSAHEVGPIRKLHPGIKLVTPGIRITTGTDDQKRVKTPMEALSEGADYLVIGRPITQSPDPSVKVDEILRLIGMR
ncbi:orotidine-5'-phosphate decarboxylase [Anaplasma capra]|uniref:orotidine-5'-phosphate decarboxylase n=1 Tax=Anaplasma capra TaxID=1562740 RepID=UPI0021D5C593|nr:orotidine-5'-phosphate decarboxylase [Anaplasma capra]MCU7611451.1 orotidine-5'-phosphate decarboxylase [Anaplasma capra]MCU7612110.1 orotidine-5'-phosphate decarboxylase [Anaplasma capra]